MPLILWLRSAFVTLILFPVLTIVCASGVFLSLLFVRGKNRGVEFFSRLWARVTCFCYGVSIEVQGREHLPEGGAMVLFNHSSFMDVFAIIANFPDWRFGAKIELFSIPVFGPAMRAIGTLPIARGNRDAAIRVLREAESRAKDHGQKFVLSPEGGRSHGDELLPFKSGPFLFAISAGVPLVPIVIKGAKWVWPKGVLFPSTKSWSSKISIQILPAVSTQGYSIEDRTKVQQEVRKVMLPFFDNVPVSNKTA